MLQLYYHRVFVGYNTAVNLALIHKTSIATDPNVQVICLTMLFVVLVFEQGT